MPLALISLCVGALYMICMRDKWYTCVVLSPSIPRVKISFSVFSCYLCFLCSRTEWPLKCTRKSNAMKSRQSRCKIWLGGGRHTLAMNATCNRFTLYTLELNEYEPWAWLSPCAPIALRNNQPDSKASRRLFAYTLTRSWNTNKLERDGGFAYICHDPIAESEKMQVTRVASLRRMNQNIVYGRPLPQFSSVYVCHFFFYCNSQHSKELRFTKERRGGGERKRSASSMSPSYRISWTKKLTILLVPV